MPLTITVTDPLAIKLQSEAAARKISVEQFALEVLGQAVQSEEWASANRRRLALIRQQFAGGLTATEEVELQELQHRRTSTWSRWIPRCLMTLQRWKRQQRKLLMLQLHDAVRLAFQYPSAARHQPCYENVTPKIEFCGYYAEGMTGGSAASRNDHSHG